MDKEARGRNRVADFDSEPRNIIPLILTICNYLSFLLMTNEPLVDSLPRLPVQLAGIYFFLSWLMALTLSAAMGTRFVQALRGKKFDVLPIALVFINLAYFILYWGNLLFFD